MPLIVRRYLAFGSMPTDRADEVMIVISDMYQHCVFFPRYSVYSPDKSRACPAPAKENARSGAGADPPPRRGYRMHTAACVRTSPPPLWGRTDSAEGRARRGVAGHGAPCRRSTQPCQPQERGLTGSPAACPCGRCRGGLLRPRGLCPATPFSLGLRPSRSSPQGGGGMPPYRCVHPVARAGRGLG